MEYTKSLINLAKGKRCDICKDIISDLQAENNEFHYTKTRAKHDVFVHKNCWSKANGKLSKQGGV